jgi:hypothetical protein
MKVYANLIFQGITQTDRMLREIFGPKKEEMAGSWKRLTWGLITNTLRSSNNNRVINSGRMGWTRHVERTDEMGNAYGIIIWKPEGKRQLRRRRRRWEDTIRRDRREIS